MQKILLLLCLTTGLYACTDSATGESAGGKFRIEGTVQKGQYIKGSSIVAYRLDETLSPTGESYPSQITDDMGSFSIGSRIDAGYVELRATGYYYNENLHALSESTLDLQAVASVTGNPVHVNLLTTLTSLRIKRLVAAGTAFDQAVSSAEAELFRALGMEGKNFSEHFTDMDITRNRDADAALLAISCLLQQGRRTAELSALIAEIAGELAENGTLTDDLRKKISDRTSEVDIAAIVLGLMKFYEERKIETYEIPPFYNYLTDNAPLFLFLDSKVSPDGSEGGSDTGFTDDYRILSNFEFTVEADCDWIEVEKERLKGDIYTVRFGAKPNSGKLREGRIIFYGPDGSIAATRNIIQKSFYQRIYLQNGASPRSADALAIAGPFHSGAEVLINGTTYTVECDRQEQPFVDVTKAERYSLCYPIGIVAPCDDIFCCTVTFPAEVSDNAQTPYYGALVPFAGTALGNPTVMQVFICTAMIRIDLSQFDQKNSVASITLEGSGDAFLSGRASYLIYDDQPGYDPSYKPSDPVFTDRSNRVTAHLSTERELCDIQIYPQLFERLDVILNDKDGNRITLRSVQNIDIRRGTLQSLRIL